MEIRKNFKLMTYLLVSSVILLLSVTTISAKMVTFIKEYTYQASEIDSKVSSRTIALELVKRLLLEELGTYLVSETEVGDFQLTKDRISSPTAAIVMAVIDDGHNRRELGWENLFPQGKNCSRY